MGAAIAQASNLPTFQQPVEVTSDDEIAPVLVLHGLNGNCNQIHSWVEMTGDAIEHQAVVKCIEIGDGNITSIFEMMPLQVATMCHKIHNDPDFAGKEMSIVGISQGGLIARSVVEQCEGLKIHTLFTFGSPHMGVTVY